MTRKVPHFTSSGIVHGSQEMRCNNQFQITTFDFSFPNNEMEFHICEFKEAKNAPFWFSFKFMCRHFSPPSRSFPGSCVISFLLFNIHFLVAFLVSLIFLEGLGCIAVGPIKGFCYEVIFDLFPPLYSLNDLLARSHTVLRSHLNDFRRHSAFPQIHFLFACFDPHLHFQM